MMMHRKNKSELMRYTICFLVLAYLGGCSQKANNTDKSATSKTRKLEDENSSRISNLVADAISLTEKKSKQKDEPKKKSNQTVKKQEKTIKNGSTDSLTSSKDQQSFPTDTFIRDDPSKKIESLENLKDGTKIKQFFESEIVDVDSNMGPNKNKFFESEILGKTSQNNILSTSSKKLINQDGKIQDVDAGNFLASPEDLNRSAGKELKIGLSKNEWKSALDFSVSKNKESKNSSPNKELLSEQNNIPENKFKENESNKISKKEFSWRERKNPSSSSGNQIELGWKERGSEKRAVTNSKTSAIEPPLIGSSRSYDSLREFIFQDRSVNSFENREGLNKGLFEKIKDWNEGRGREWKGDSQSEDVQRYKEALKWIQQKGRTITSDTEQE